MGIDEYASIIKEIERMVEIYKKVENDNARKIYSQYINLIVEQTGFGFNEKSDLREYWRRSVR